MCVCLRESCIFLLNHNTKIQDSENLISTMNKKQEAYKKLFSEIRARFYQEFRNKKGRNRNWEIINYSFASARNGIREGVNQYSLRKIKWKYFKRNTNYKLSMY